MSRILALCVTALGLALSALRRNILRSTLTSFGILIGVAAVTTVVALGEGASRTVSGRIATMGENSVTIHPRWDVRSSSRGRQRSPELTEQDLEAIEREVSHIAAAAPVLESSAQLSWREANVASELVGTNLDFFTARGWGLDAGVFWTESAETIGESVCVIGASVRSELFGTLDPVGRTLRIGRQPFRVLGVLEPKGQTPFGKDQDKVLVLPLKTLRGKLQPTRPGVVGRILLSVEEGKSASRVKRQSELVLRQRRMLAEGAENDFEIRTQDEFQETQKTVLGVLTLLLSSIAAISMVVGGIGVMNIMLVSVAERTREIGIRLAIGAREVDILMQFLIEAVVLSVLGGAAGVLVAVAAVAGIGHVLDWQLSVSPRALVVAVGISMAIGVVFGFVPARRAARSDPIQALGRE